MSRHIDKEALVAAIKQSHELSDEQKSDIIGLIRTEKSYGLVWEDSKEDACEVLKTKVPILREVKDKIILNDSKDEQHPNHILIEGENLQALVALTYTHAGMIDVIYVDPPYNTGAKNWRYNNDYIDSEDGYRHSKFISFIRHRFEIAKTLLSERGIIICAIDDYEEHNVRHIMDDIFGEHNRLGTVTVIHNPRGRNDDTFIATMHEYYLFYAKDASVAEIGYFPMSEKDIKAYNKSDEISAFNETSFIRTGNNSLRTERPGLWYEIYYNNNTGKLSLSKEDENDILLLPINGKGEERCWRWGPETFERLKDTELFVKEVKGEYKIYKKRRITNIEGRKPKTVWLDSKYDASSNGIILLQNIFDGTCPFPYPKSLYAVYDSLLITLPKNGTVLDFFAGSGTTMHATMQLNAEDGGHRQCILVTNNENNICEEVTYERNKRVIEGYTTPKGEYVEGLKKNNLRYYKVELTNREQNHKQNKELVKGLKDLLCIKENIYQEVNAFGSLSLVGKEQMLRCFVEGERQMLMVYDSRVIPYLVKEIERMTQKTKIYLFADGAYPYTEDFRTVLDKVDLVPLPYAYQRAIKYALPDADPAWKDDADLTEEEQNTLMEEAIEAENNETKKEG